MSAVSRALGAAVLLTACGGDSFQFPGVDEPCWPIPEATPGGAVEVGTGDVGFEPITAAIAIIANASQSDPFLQIHARVSGIPGGDPDNPFDPKNPRTKVSAVIDELGLTLGVECPASLGYIPVPGMKAADLVRSLRVGFGTFPIDQAANKQVRVIVEVVGSNGRYARDEKMSVLMLPPPPGP